jgi:hypothetical protein
MAKNPDLPKFTLTRDERRGDWRLTNDRTGRTVERFETKSDATKGGALKEVLPSGAGSVKIQKIDGRFQEERTFPRSKDPKGSPG